jgi:hypothetical protein
MSLPLDFFTSNKTPNIDAFLNKIKLFLHENHIDIGKPKNIYILLAMNNQS